METQKTENTEEEKGASGGDVEEKGEDTYQPAYTSPDSAPANKTAQALPIPHSPHSHA